MSFKDHYINEENYLRDMEGTVKPYLTQRREDGYFIGGDGRRLHYVRYKADDAKRAVVICHGFTESCEKYTELAYYFLREGYSVFIPDQRGHGKSYRHVPDMTLTHVERFTDYVDDMERFMDTVVRRDCPLTPLYFFCHSMGGGVGMLYVMRHQYDFRRVVLSSPMVQPKGGGGLPFWAQKAVIEALRVAGQSKKRVFFAGEYTGSERFEDSCAGSPARYEYYASKKRSTRYLQNYSPTTAWVGEALKVRGMLLAENAPENVSTPVLIFSASEDTTVENEAQRQLAGRLKNGRFINVSGAKHEIYMCSDDVYLPYLEELFAFLNGDG